MGSYFVGGVFGLSYFEFCKARSDPEFEDTYANKIYNNLKTNRILPYLSLGLGLLIVWKWHLDHNAYRGGLANESNTFYTAAIGLIVAPTLVGRLTFLNNFLSLGVFEILGKLSFNVYLIQFWVLRYVIHNQTESTDISVGNHIYITIKFLILTFLIAIPVWLAWEMPFNNLSLLIFFAKNEPKSCQKKI